MIKTGATRIVLVLHWFVIKVPNFRNHIDFLQGCYANWSERVQTKKFNKKNKDEFLLFAPSYYCSWFGLLQIQTKCKPLQRDLTSKELEKFEDICNSDSKKENFGILNDKIVCLDYPWQKKFK